MSRVPTEFTHTEGNIIHGVRRESCTDPAQSEPLSICGNFLHENREIPNTVHLNMIIGFLFSFLTVFFGFTVWEYFCSGVWMDVIILKFVLSGAFLILLGLAIFLGRGDRFASKQVLVTYALSFAVVVALGYYGGGLAFGAKAVPAPPEYEAGENIYTRNCSACHPFGGNIVNARLSVAGVPRLVTGKMRFLSLFFLQGLPMHAQDKVPGARQIGFCTPRVVINRLRRAAMAVATQDSRGDFPSRVVEFQPLQAHIPRF